MKDNFQMMKLKDEIQSTVEHYKEKVGELQLNSARYLKAKSILSSILISSGIDIQSIRDLK